MARPARTKQKATSCISAARRWATITSQEPVLRRSATRERPARRIDSINQSSFSHAGRKTGAAFIETTIEIVASLIMVFGGIALIQEIHRNVTFRTVVGRAAGWTAAPSSDGKRILGHRAQVRYEVAGVAHEGECGEASEDEVVNAHPVGASIRLRYSKGNLEELELKGNLKARFAFPFGALTLGLALFVVTSFILRF